MQTYKNTNELLIMPPDIPPEENLDQSLVPVSGTVNEQLDALALVLSAVGIDHFFDESTHQLLVKRRDAALAEYHLNLYHSENANWPPPPPPRPRLHPQTPPTWLMMGLLAVFFLYTGPWSAGNLWFTRGAIDSAAVLDRGEWWRLLTALTLHADVVHLVGNCLIGGIIMHFLSKTIGYGLAWLLLLANGIIANLLNIVLRRLPHLSVGLSTSIFAAIGLFTGLQLSRFKTQGLKGLLLPLAAGAGLLAFLGSEGERTDLGAHFFGFVCGVCCGVILNLTGFLEKTRPPLLQFFFFFIAVATLLTSWFLACTDPVTGISG
jgi:membrane associated rhomboid family serine protease